MRDIRKLLALRAATTQKRMASAKARVELPSEEEIERWTRHLDTRQTSVREFLEGWEGWVPYRIDTKETQADGTNMVDYRLWPAQLRLLESVEESWADGHAAKLIIVKDREQGCSKMIQSLIWERFVRGGGGEARTVSHKDSATKNLSWDFESFKLQTPEWVFSALLEAEWASDAEARWELIFKGGRHATAQTMTCRDGAMGRGDRIRWSHYSEYPWWTSGKGNLAGALATLADSPGNLYVIESTGKDFDEFYSLACKARDGLSDWKLVFLSWLTHPKKRYFFRSESEKAAFIESVGKLDAYDMKEEAQLVGLGAEPEQLKWRRLQIDGPVCNGDLLYFAREHPARFEQAFYADSDCVFDAMALDSWRPVAETEWKRKWLRGVIEVHKEGKRRVARFEESKQGCWWIKKLPVPGRSYTWGADPSSGRKIVDQGKREGDFACVEVRDVETKEIVAMHRGHVPPEDFAVEIVACAMLYGLAKGYVESNNDGRTVLHVVSELEMAWDLEDTVLLAQKRLVPSKGGDVFEYHPGFYSDAKSKPVALNRMKAWVRKIGVRKEGEDGECPFPLPLLDEMRMYVALQNVSAKTGRPTGNVRYEASQGHDDRVSASYLCLEACEWLTDNVSQQRPVGAKMDDDPFVRMWSEQAAYEERQAQNKSDSDLGRMF